MPAFEEEYADILQNIEFAIVQTYREDRDITDWTVQTAIEALVRTYEAEMRERTPRPLRLSEQEQALYDHMRSMCEWRLGRSELTVKHGQLPPMQPTPLVLDQITACLKRIERSVKHWHKNGGRRGYLDFISQFL